MKKNKAQFRKLKSSMSFDTVKCPMCFRNFSADFIELHAQKCKGENYVDNSGSGATKERPQSKKMKLSVGALPVLSSNPKALSQTVGYAGDRLNSCTVLSQEEKVSTTSHTPRNVEKGNIPLAEQIRPCSFNEYVGQEKILGKGSMLIGLLRHGQTPSMILWGPPGCGKTSLAHVIATENKSNPGHSTRFVKLSATNSGKADIQSAIEAAKNERRIFKRKTILFIDEIHRFNKLQQDTFLPHIENGTIILIGATTENPSFSLNSALLSRCRVIVLEKLSLDDVKQILVRSLKNFGPSVAILYNNRSSHLIAVCGETSADDSCSCTGIDSSITISEDAIDFLAGMCDGDARTALNGLEMAMQAVEMKKHIPGDAPLIDLDSVKKSLHRSHVLYDRAGDQHYEIISAFQKSIRGSDANATLYWLARMLEGGEDPRFIARRMIRIASEDIGIADSCALTLAVSTQQACQFIGMPECDVVLAHCAVYLARAPKSAEVYMALRNAVGKIRSHDGPLPGVPLHLRNASTKLMKDLGYGRGYQYKPSSEAKQTYLPDSLLNCNFFDQ